MAERLDHPSLQIEVPQIIIHKADQPYVVVNLLDADGLSSKDLAEIDFFVAQTDAATASDHDGFVVEGIVDVRQPGVGTGGRLVDFRRTLHIQSFVRALVVEDLNEFIEAGLLLQEVGGRRLGGFFLQGEMHALVTTILQGSTGFDPLDANTQAKPPDRKFAQVEQGVSRSEGNAVVAADVGRQATLLKKPLKHRERVVFSGRRKRFTSEQKTAGVIGDRERITVLAIAQQELAFVIRTPELIGALSQR